MCYMVLAFSFSVCENADWILLYSVYLCHDEASGRFLKTVKIVKLLSSEIFKSGWLQVRRLAALPTCVFY